MLELVYTYPDGHEEVRYRRPHNHPDIAEWKEKCATSPYYRMREME